MTGAVLDAPPLTRVPGKYETLCWERHRRDLAFAASPGGHPLGFTFDADAGDRVVTFVEKYGCHTEGEWAGLPLILEEWQRDIIRIVFGWRRADGTRRFRTAYIEIPRKNGKTLVSAGLALYLTIADGEHGAQVYVTATKKDQAKIMWGAAERMVRHSSRLRKVVAASKTAVYCERLGSRLEPLGANSDTQDGLNAHAQLADEMHAHKDRHIFDVVSTSMGARRQPLNWIITTAGEYKPESIGWEMHERATMVLDGVIDDPHFFAFIAGADAGDAWDDPATWAKANPNLNVSVKLDYLHEQAERAKTSPAFRSTFERYHLNRWESARETWIPAEQWAACNAPVTHDDLKGRRAFLAVDLSTKLDISAVAACVPQDGGTFDFVWKFYCPEATVLQRSQVDRVPYDAWVRDGWMIATPGDTVDYEFIERDVLALTKEYQVSEIGFDPWNASQFANSLMAQGLTVVEMRQGPRTLSEATKQFQALVVSRKLRHGNNPVMRWMVANAAIRVDANENIAPDKKHATGRIDGVVAAIMALGRAILQPAKPVSVYETRGALVF